MTGTLTPRVFRRDAKVWTVMRSTSSPSRHETGLRFVHQRETRFLAFTRGALPSDRELDTMSEEVLRVLLERARR